jgi:hypothetical protein
MRRCRPRVIMRAEMSGLGPSRSRIAAPDEKDSWPRMIEVSPRVDRTPVTLAVRGDPVVGRALALLLSPCCGVRCLAVSSLSEPESLRDVRLLLLAPTPDLSAKRREAHLGSLPAGALSGVPVLELVVSSGGTLVVSRVSEVPWPCSTEKLKRHIEAALLTDPRAEQAARRPLTYGGGR